MDSMAVRLAGAELPDEMLVRAAREGDREAFSRLVERYRDLVFAYAVARLRNRDEAEDVAQEVFAGAFARLDRLRGPGAWSAWLMRIARNQCTDSERRRRVRTTEPMDPDWLDAGPTPERALLSTERSREIAGALSRLPEEHRVPLVMHFVYGYSYWEIALALGLPESTVFGRSSRALRVLRRKLGEMDR